MTVPPKRRPTSTAGTIQPRPTKASALRTSAQTTSTNGPVTKTTSTVAATATTTKKVPSSNSHRGSQASEGVRAFMSKQRSRLNKSKEQPTPPDDTDKPKRSNVMTGAQRYTDSHNSVTSSEPDTSNLKSVIQQAKSSGKLNISHRHLQTIPEQILKMYHVDPNSIVVDFNSSGGDAWYDTVELTKFVAAYNDIVSMDERVGTEFRALALLDFRYNRLNSLPTSLANLCHLTSLQLAYNQFESIPDIVFELHQLRELNMAHNQISILPEQVSSLNLLETLDLSHNQIGPALPLGMTSLAVLRKLNLDHNRLASLSIAFAAAWQKLEDLSLSHNRLTRFLSEDDGDDTHVTTQYVLRSLTRLDIRHNNLKQFTRNLQLPQLKELLLAGNALTTLTEDDEDKHGGTTDYSFLQHSPLLVTLDVGSNSWSMIPKDVMQLSELQRLDISGNDLRYLPSALGSLSHLLALTWEGNPLRSVPRNISMTELIESLRAAQISQGQSEDDNVDKGNGNGNDCVAHIPSIPARNTQNSDDGVSNTPPSTKATATPLKSSLTSTRLLDLSNKKLTEIPESLVAQHTDVQTLHLHHNDLKSISLLHLTRFSTTLVHLSLERNKLVTFPLIFPGNLTALKKLCLANNRLQEITYGEDDKTSSCFPALTELDISGNSLTQLPPKLTTRFLPSLRILNCNTNKLTSIDPEDLTNVEVLDIGNNDISILPPALGLISSIQELTAYGNRFRVPQPSLLAQGTPAVMAFLKRRAGVATE